MKNYMKEYINKIDKLLKQKEIDNLDEVISEHLIKIRFFSHERLVHLLVTILFALLSLISFFYTLSNLTIGLLLLTILFLCLLVPYIFHYYFLENSVQYMYKQYDLLTEKRNLLT